MLKKSYLNLICSVSLMVLSTFAKVSDVYALSCTASIGSTVVENGSITNISYQITNLGPESVSTVKIESGNPSVFQINGGSASGWTTNFDDSSITYSGSTIAASQTVSFTFTIEALQESGPVTIDAILVLDGSELVCDGRGSLETGEIPDSPVISDLTVSVGSTSASLSWVTSEAASSNVSYGTTTSYGSTAGDNNLTASHSVSLTGLSASTTYYYQVCSTNGAGLQSCSGQNTFTTSAAGTTTTTTVTTTTTTSAVAVDNTAPKVTIATDFKTSYDLAPEITGKVTDDIGVTAIEYSIDGGVNWLPVDSVSGIGKSVGFSFLPSISEDGNYKIQVRGKDSSGNSGLSQFVTLVIDRLPPKVSGSLMYLGPLVLMPNDAGVIQTLSGIEQKVYLSSVGGAVSMELYVDDNITAFSQSQESGLWSGNLKIDKQGTYRLKTKAVDGASNVTEGELSRVEVLQSGRVLNASTKNPVSGGQIAVYVKDTETNSWNLWEGGTFSQENPQMLKANGNYQYILPSGSYYITLKIAGEGMISSKIFTLDIPTLINSTILIDPPKKITLGPISFALPSIFSKKFSVVLKTNQEDKVVVVNPLIGKTIEHFTLPATDGSFSSASLQGENFMLSFINSWSPSSLEQLAILNNSPKNSGFTVLPVALGDSQSKISVLAKIGNYTLPIVVDADGELMSDYQIRAQPTHIFIDRKGVIKNVVVGVLSSEELEQEFFE